MKRFSVRLLTWRIHYYLASAALSLFFVSCAPHPAVNQKPKEISVEQLLSSPTQSDGTRVLVKGFFLLPMVGDMALYQNEPDYHNHPVEGGVRVDVDNQKNNLMTFQLKTCLVEGTFHASHDAVVRSSLNEITRFELAK